MTENQPDDENTAASHDGAAFGAQPEQAAAQAVAQPEATDPLGDEQQGEEDPAAGLQAVELRAVVEALIFVAKEPLTPRELGQVLQGIPKADWLAAIEELREQYARPGRGLQLVDVAGGYQITTRPEWNDYLRELLDPKSPTKLSIQALETLAVIAYKQPVTLPEVIELRGVKSGGVLKTLLEKRLIKIVGRKEVVGRPMLYGTTKDFLLHFGLKDLSELPRIEEFAEVLGEEVDIAGLKRAIESPRPVEVPLSEEESVPAEPQPEAAAAEAGTETSAGSPEDGPPTNLK